MIVLVDRMPLDPDEIFEKLVKGLSPIWGPFYALFYIIRLLWRELRKKG